MIWKTFFVECVLGHLKRSQIISHLIITVHCTSNESPEISEWQVLTDSFGEELKTEIAYFLNSGNLSLIYQKANQVSRHFFHREKDLEILSADTDKWTACDRLRSVCGETWRITVTWLCSSNIKSKSWKVWYQNHFSCNSYFQDRLLLINNG